ncbi:MAG TPA: DegT/DnrJ/EryC1/StrS family aminotransferase [Polyangia bacterium]|jgi:dTDP-4-amino-4,6-dideoxygalactose transaminase|nr:DegT/DnrJ/EryC1/StrS family aminotransferase [Polyangia bacterium]
MTATAADIPQTNPRASYVAHQEEIDTALLRVLTGGRYILGPEVTAFETAFAAFVGAAQAIGVANGTDALTLALRGSGIGAGDVVVTTAHTAGATIAAIELAGAIPLFVDIDPATFTLDPDALAAALATPPAGVDRTAIRAVVPVHLYGQLADMPAISAIAARAKLLVIEDCAQAHGATLDGRAAGTWGAAAAFSFYPTKNLGAFGDGGAVVTSDGAIAARVRALREYGWHQRYINSEKGPGQGMNSRLDELQAAILRVKLPYLNADNARRVAIAAGYDRGLAAADVATPHNRPGAASVYHQYVIRAAARDRLRETLAAAGIGTLIHYPVPAHLQPAYQRRLPIAGPMAHTETACRQILSLPMFPELTDADVQRVVAAVTAALPRTTRKSA